MEQFFYVHGEIYTQLNKLKKVLSAIQDYGCHWDIYGIVNPYIFHNVKSPLNEISHKTKIQIRKEIDHEFRTIDI